MRAWITWARQRGTVPVVALVPVFTAGCAEPEVVETWGVAAQPVHLGVATTDYPEVGKVSGQLQGVDADCTGTLVAKNIVLTAKHCLPAPNTGEFTLEGQANPFKVLKTYASDAPIVTKIKGKIGEATVDLGLLCIESVPAKADGGVDPVEVGTVDDIPAVGADVTTVGYGQNDRIAGTGSGTKRKRTWKYQAAFFGLTGVLGKGDSGGPTYNAAGKVLLVSAGCSNVVADVPPAPGAQPPMELYDFFATPFHPHFTKELKKKREEEWQTGCS